MDPSVTAPPSVCGSAVMFLRALAVLALDFEGQVDWLRSLGLGEPALCDELADEYYQQWLLLPQLVVAGLIPGAGVATLNELNDLLGEIIKPGSNLGTIGSLRSAAEWEQVRRKAATSLCMVN